MTLARIKNVTLYVGLTADVQACWELKKLLVENQIPHTILAYFDDAVHADVFESLNSWTWGKDAEKRTFTRFPVVTWENCYDDFTIQLECALSASEAKSKLLPHASLIK